MREKTKEILKLIIEFASMLIVAGLIVFTVSTLINNYYPVSRGCGL